MSDVHNRVARQLEYAAALNQRALAAAVLACVLAVIALVLG